MKKLTEVFNGKPLSPKEEVLLSAALMDFAPDFEADGGTLPDFVENFKETDSPEIKRKIIQWLKDYGHVSYIDNSIERAIRGGKNI